MNKEKKIALHIVKGIIALHFFLLFLYCIPDGVLNDKTKAVASAYANPLFSGRWNLFAPDPPKRHKEIIYRNNSDWKKVVTKTEERHNAVRIGASTKMYHIIQNASHYLWEDYFKYSGDSIKMSVGYRSMGHLIEKHIEKETGLRAFDNIEMALIIQSAPGFNGETPETDTLFFPPYQIVQPYQ